MEAVDSGDRVQILCASHLADGTPLDSDETRKTPYWVRAGKMSRPNAAGEAVLGMKIGDRKTVTLTPHSKRTVTLELEVVAIRVRNHST